MCDTDVNNTVKIRIKATCMCLQNMDNHAMLEATNCHLFALLLCWHHVSKWKF